MSKTRPGNSRFFIGLGVVLICVVAAVSLKAYFISQRQTQFIAHGKLLAGLQVNPISTNEQSFQMQAFYGTQLEIIESGEMHRRALERVQGEHPELKEIDVEIRATQTKGSSIINIAAIGGEPKFTRAFLDSLLVEYIAFGREMRQKSVDIVMNRIFNEVLMREKDVKDKSAALLEFSKIHDVRLLEIEHERLALRVSSLRGEIENLRRSNPDGAKLKEAQTLLAESEKLLTETNELHLKSQQLKVVCELSQKGYRDWMMPLEGLGGGCGPRDYISIMERPGIADEIEPELVLPLLSAAWIGAVVGGILAVIISALMGKPSSSLSPPPLPPA